jgi:drug/metabolite transporter (DMT)-like permease
VLFGFIGVLIIVRPGAAGFAPASLVALSAAVLSAAVTIAIKVISRTEAADDIVIFTTIIWAVLSLIPALFVWTWPDLAGWVWGGLAGLIGTLAHLTWTRALKISDASALTPISFTQLPLVALLAWWLFGETIDRWTVGGAMVIFVSTAYIAHREMVVAHRQRPRSSPRPA